MVEPYTPESFTIPPPPLDKLVLIRQLGRGGYGVAYLVSGEDRRGPLYALKIFFIEDENEGINSAAITEMAAHEAALSSRLSYDDSDDVERDETRGVLPILAYGVSVFPPPSAPREKWILRGDLPVPHEVIADLYEDEDFSHHSFTYIITPYLERDLSSLAPLLTSFEQVRHIWFQLLVGLAHFEAAHVLHRDLSPHNIFAAGVDVPYRVVIGDGGFASIHPQPSDDNTDGGVVYYRAPEINAPITGATYTPAADVYSLGVIIVELLRKGERLFDDERSSWDTSSTKLPPRLWGTRHLLQHQIELSGTFDFSKTYIGRNDPDAVLPIFPKEGIEDRILSKVKINPGREALTLLGRMLDIDPVRRPRAKDMVSSPLFSVAGMSPPRVMEAKCNSRYTVADSSSVNMAMMRILSGWLMEVALKSKFYGLTPGCVVLAMHLVFERVNHSPVTPITLQGYGIAALMLAVKVRQGYGEISLPSAVKVCDDEYTRDQIEKFEIDLLDCGLGDRTFADAGLEIISQAGIRLSKKESQRFEALALLLMTRCTPCDATASAIAYLSLCSGESVSRRVGATSDVALAEQARAIVSDVILKEVSKDTLLAKALQTLSIPFSSEKIFPALEVST